MKKLFTFIAAALLSINVAQAVVPDLAWGTNPIPTYSLSPVEVYGGNLIGFYVKGMYPITSLSVGGQKTNLVLFQIDGLNIVNGNDTLTLHVASDQPNNGNYTVGETVYSPYGNLSLCCGMTVLVGGYGRVAPQATVQAWDPAKRILVLSHVNGTAFLPSGKTTIVGSQSGVSYSNFDWEGSLGTASLLGEVACSSTVVKRGQASAAWLKTYLTTNKTYSVVVNSLRSTGTQMGPVIMGDVLVNGVSLKSTMIAQGFNSTSAEFVGCNLTQ
jgi:hypothetical protein